MLMQARLLNQEMAAINLGRIYTYSDPPPPVFGSAQIAPGKSDDRGI